MATRLYRRRIVGWRGYAVPIFLWAAGSALLLANAPDGNHTFNVVISLIAPGTIFGIWWLTVWSVNVYGAMTITHDTMKVGRTRVPLAVLDRDWLLALARTEAPAGFARFARSAGTIQAGRLNTLDHAQGRLIGGAFAIPLGASQMTLRKTNGEMITMPVKDRAEALTALLEAASQRPGPG